MKYSVITTVAEVFHHQPIVRVEKDGTEHQVDCGWFVKLDGSYEAIHVGDERPIMAVGDNVKITIEKINES